MKFEIPIILFLSILSIPAAPSSAAVNGRETSVKSTEKKPVDLEERTNYLLNQCSGLLKKANWTAIRDGSQIKAYRLENRYDVISVRVDAGYFEDFYTFTVAINKNGKETSKTFVLSAGIVNDDDRLRDIVLSAIVPAAVLREGIGDFRKAYSSIFSFGYARTNDSHEFYPNYQKGKLHLSWRLQYDPSASELFRETPLSIGDYFTFDIYFDLANKIQENFFNIELLLYGKNKYTGSAEHGTRFIYGFFNGFEYFRPGFSDSVVKWDQEIYDTRPYIQYAIWRALQWNMMISHRDGSSVYSAGLMLGAGVGVGPSSLFYSGLTEEEEKNISHVFRSIRYRKQNYYYSYTLPGRISLCADNIYGFRFELGYNYYFFYPVLTDNLWDMLHIVKGTIGYYLSPDVLLNAQYERWIVESMLHDKKKQHNWNRLIIEFRNYY